MTRRERGFTLMEAVLVIAITGILGAIVAVFIRRPVEGYLDVARRAQLTDVADTALRRITRDLRQALPNSVRVHQAGGAYWLEYLQVAGGGRYRAAIDTGSEDPLEFDKADASFDVLASALPAFAAGAYFVIVGNLGPGSGSDAYLPLGDASGSRTAWTGIAAGRASIAAHRFPVDSPSRRFQVVDMPVSYECNPVSGELRRHWGYPIGAAQPAPPAGGASALLAGGVSGCAIAYDQSVAATARGLVSLQLELASGGERVVLFQQAHVNNAP